MVVDFPRPMFIDEECGYLKVNIDGGLITRNISRKKKSEGLPAYKSLLYDKC